MQAIMDFMSNMLGSDMGAAKVVSDPECLYKDYYPRQYVAYKTDQLNPEKLDGNLNKQVWQEVAWTEDFVDISTSTTPHLRTRAKVRWDEQFLYVGAEMEETQIWGSLKDHDSVIFKDNDIEIFIDPNATNHGYKEFEMNALNTTWNLKLNKPYENGGHENSTRISGPFGWTMEPPLRSAVFVDPPEALNNPAVKGKQWSVEVALPINKLIEDNGGKMPAPGVFWRMAFSRVQYATIENATTKKYQQAPSCQSCEEPGAPLPDNWVWSTQGVVNEHRPETWGILQFADGEVQKTPVAPYKEWTSRMAAMAVYYAQMHYAEENNGNFAESTEELAYHSNPRFPICEAAKTEITLLPPPEPEWIVDSDGVYRLYVGGPSFVANVISPASPEYVATVLSSRYLTVADRVVMDEFAEAAAKEKEAVKEAIEEAVENGAPDLAELMETLTTKGNLSALVQHASLSKGNLSVNASRVPLKPIVEMAPPKAATLASNVHPAMDFGETDRVHMLQTMLKALSK